MKWNKSWINGGDLFARVVLTLAYLYLFVHVIVYIGR